MFPRPINKINNLYSVLLSHGKAHEAPNNRLLGDFYFYHSTHKQVHNSTILDSKPERTGKDGRVRGVDISPRDY
jgi:hypothetical protein